MNKSILLLLCILVLVYFALFVFNADDLFSAKITREKLDVNYATDVDTTADGAVVIDVEGAGFAKDVRVFSHYDVNNRSAIVGSFPVSGAIFDIERVGDLLFVSSLVDGLRSFDVSNPLQPVMRPEKYRTNTTFLEIERRGDEFFFSCGRQGVLIAKLDERGRLADWKNLPSLSVVVDTAVIDQRIFMAAGKDGLLVYDLDQLEEYRPIAQYKEVEPIRQVEAYGRYLFTVNGQGGVFIYRLDDQDLPVKVGAIPVNRYAKSITIVDDFLYLLENNRLAKFDLARPETPALVIEQHHFSSPLKLFSFGEKVFVADNHSGLAILDVAGGHSVRSAGFVNLGGDSRAACMVGGLLYVGVTNKGILIIDPKKIMPRQVVETIEGQGLIRDFRLFGDYAIVVDSVAGIGFKRLDGVSAMEQLIGLKRNASIAFSGDRFFVTQLRAPMQVFDLTDIEKPKLIAEWKGLAGYPVVRDSYLFLGKAADGLEFWDISDYAAPKRLDSVEGILATQITLQGDLVFVSGEREGVRVYQIAGGRLKLLSHIQLPFPVSQFTRALKCVVRDDTLFVANGAAGLMIVDVRDPSKPEILSSLRLPGDASDVMVEDDRVYLLSRYYGLHTIDVNVLRAPRLLDSLPLSDVWRGMQRSDDLFWLANRFMGVTAIPFPEEIENVKRISSKKLRITVPKPKYPGRYSLQIGDAKGTVDLEGVVTFQ